MKKEYFVEQPNLELMPGVRVTEETEGHYKNEIVEQVIKDLKLETILNQKGSNGLNSYENRSYIRVDLNPGDILLFDKQRGFYLPAFAVSSVEDAAGDIAAMQGVHYPETDFEEDAEEVEG